MSSDSDHQDWENDEVIQRLRDYLKIPSVHPNIDYGDCVTFLKNQAKLINLPVAVYELVPKKPIVVITWTGVRPELPSILLNSHMDVVPVYEDYWSLPPFGAFISEEGWIFARGAQDMKSVGMMHLETVRRLKAAGVALNRTVHVSFVPDEEINGVEGMREFAMSEEFKRLKVGFGLDESLPTLDDKVIIAYHGERTARQIKVTSHGEPAHGSLLPENTAGEKLHYVVDKLMKLRTEEKKILDGGAALGDVITVNLTQLEGGVQFNVLPEKLSATFDIRIPPFVDHDHFEEKILKWCEEAGNQVYFEYIEKNPEIKSTNIDSSNPFWTVMKDAVQEMGLDIRCVICPGATDARYVRRQGIPVINFSPILKTPPLLHGHDERIHVDTYKQGIDIMEKVLVAIANVDSMEY